MVLDQDRATSPPVSQLSASRLKNLSSGQRTFLKSRLLLTHILWKRYVLISMPIEPNVDVSCNRRWIGTTPAWSPMHTWRALDWRRPAGTAYAVCHAQWPLLPTWCCLIWKRMMRTSTTGKPSIQSCTRQRWTCVTSTMSFHPRRHHSSLLSLVLLCTKAKDIPFSKAPTLPEPFSIKGKRLQAPFSIKGKRLLHWSFFALATFSSEKKIAALTDVLYVKVWTVFAL